METLRLVLLFVHVLGFAALLGGLLVQVRDETKTVNATMRDGTGTAFKTINPATEEIAATLALCGVDDVDRAVRAMGLGRSVRTLLKLNQTDGFDCPGCAWGDNDHGTFQFCENGAKAVATSPGVWKRCRGSLASIRPRMRAASSSTAGTRARMSGVSAWTTSRVR